MTVQLRLFVAGQTSRATSAAATLAELAERVWPGEHELEVVDVLDRPDLADEAHVLATPMVLQIAPLPQRRVVGDLSDIERLARALGVQLPSPNHGETV